MKRMNEQMAATVLHYPAWTDEEGPDKSASTSSEASRDADRLSWFRRQLVALGVLDMAPSTKPQTPINFQKLSFALAVFVAIVTGYYGAYRMGESTGRESERQTVINEQLQKKLDVQAEKQEYFERLINAVIDGKPTPTPLPKEQK